VALLLLTTIIYNSYFHTLQNLPGPKLAAASKLPCIYNRLVGLQVRWTQKLYYIYGEVVHLSPSQLFHLCLSLAEYLRLYSGSEEHCLKKSLLDHHLEICE
ncbi:hypothetical protein B0J12DRAFT_587078, partial [Macrophomina phaseolina]